MAEMKFPNAGEWEIQSKDNRRNCETCFPFASLMGESNVTFQTWVSIWSVACHESEGTAGGQENCYSAQGHGAVHSLDLQLALHSCIMIIHGNMGT